MIENILSSVVQCPKKKTATLVTIKNGKGQNKS